MILLKNVTKRYGDIIALNRVSLKIGEGELIVLKGVSGSGKSTILSLIAGLNRPTEGEVIVGEKRVSKLPDSFASKYRQEMIGFIFQRYNLISNLSVEENILTPLIPLNPNEALVKSRIDELLNKFELEDKRIGMVKNLSGGQQQRVAIARALINQPKIIIADEPTANLDEVLSQNFIQILGSLKNDGKTIIVATHDPLFFDLDIVDRIIELKGGKVISN